MYVNRLLHVEDGTTINNEDKNFKLEKNVETYLIL